MCTQNGMQDDSAVSQQLWPGNSTSQDVVDVARQYRSHLVISQASLHKSALVRFIHNNRR